MLVEYNNFFFFFLSNLLVKNNFLNYFLIFNDEKYTLIDNSNGIYYFNNFFFFPKFLIFSKIFDLYYFIVFFFTLPFSFLYTFFFNFFLFFNNIFFFFFFSFYYLNTLFVESYLELSNFNLLNNWIKIIFSEKNKLIFFKSNIDYYNNNNDFKLNNFKFIDFFFFFNKENYFSFFYNLNKNNIITGNFFYIIFHFFSNFFLIFFDFFFLIKEFFFLIQNLFFNTVTFNLFLFIYNFLNNNKSTYYIDTIDINNYNYNWNFFSSNYLNNNSLNNIKYFFNEESSSNYKKLKSNNPVFKYDYKSGDYFPKLYKEVYAHLFSSIFNLTSGLKPSVWFFSNNFNEIFKNNFNEIFKNFNKTFFFEKNINTSWFQNKFNTVDEFYFFFFCLQDKICNKNEIFNNKYISLSSLSNKFNKLFLSSSLQQRIYSNWRQLKFTREAWRCKLLLSRHQKTLFRRYLNEDGVFWSIERNAKDLIPGWAMITPFSSRIRFTAIGKTDIGLMGVLLVLNSSIISGANFLVTYRYLSTLNNRKMRDARAFFTEAIMVSSWMMILANPMLVIGIIMLLSDRHWQTSFFDYSGGGDTVLFQHMFWFFGHPEVYIIIIPTFGFTNTMLSYYLKKRVSARASLLYSMYTIAFLGFFVWGHHMYMVGLSHTTRMLFSTLTVMISVPAATKIMHWCVTTVNSSFIMELPLLFTFTFIFFFVSGGISGMCVAHTGMDVLFHDTFYVIGHFHVMLAGGAMFASFGAFYFYFPSIFGVKYSRLFAYLHYTYYFIGQLMTVIPMFWLGYAGMPRRVLDYPASFGGWHSVISAGHMLNVAGLMAFFIMIFDSLRQSKAVIRNSFGISRFNTRLNFYIYETSRLIFLSQKTFFLYRYMNKNNFIKLNNFFFINYESYESTLLTYSFSYIKK